MVARGSVGDSAVVRAVAWAEIEDEGRTLGRYCVDQGILSIQISHCMRMGLMEGHQSIPASARGGLPAPLKGIDGE